MKWYDWHTVVDRLTGRCLALTRGLPYSVKLSPVVDAATCNPESGVITINPEAFDDKIKTGNIDLRDKTNYLVTRALLGHEVLHALYFCPHSIPKDPTTRLLANILEDARIEGIGAYESYVNRELFGLLAKLAVKSQPPFTDLGMTDNSSWIELLLRKRFNMELPVLSSAENRMKFSKLLDLYEQALFAVDTLGVNKIASQMKVLCGLDQNDANKKNYGKNTTDLGSGKGQDTQKNPRKDKPTPQQAPEPPEPESDTKAKPDNKEKPEKSDKQESKPKPKPKADKDKEDKSESKPKSKKQNKETSESDVEPDESEKQDEPESKDESTDESTDESEDEADGSPLDTELDDNSQDSKESNSKDSSPDESLSQESPGGTGKGAGLGESLEEMIAELQDKLNEDIDSSLAELEKLSKDKVCMPQDRHNSTGYEIVQKPYIQLIEEARPIAKEIAKDLKLQAPNSSMAADRNSGRFKMRYHMRNPEVPFAKKKSEGKAVPPMAMVLLIDRSGSMISSAWALKVAATAIVLVCEELNIPLEVRCFSGNNLIKKFDEWGPQVYARLSGMGVNGGTDMQPCLDSATKDFKERPELLKQVVVIHDGGPADPNGVRNWIADKSNPDLFAMYVLPSGLNPKSLEMETKNGHMMMGQLFDPRNYIVTEVDKALRAWCSYMKIFRNHYAKNI